MRGYGLSTPQQPMRWSERVAMVSRVVPLKTAKKLIAKHIEALSAQPQVEICCDESPLYRFIKSHKRHRRPKHTHHWSVRKPNG